MNVGNVGVGIGPGFVNPGSVVAGVASPSSPSSSSGLSITVGQELADVVVAVGVMLQPLDRDELVVLQLVDPVDPEVTEVHETK